MFKGISDEFLKLISKLTDQNQKKKTANKNTPGFELLIRCVPTSEQKDDSTNLVNLASKKHQTTQKQNLCSISEKRKTRCFRIEFRIHRCRKKKVGFIVEVYFLSKDDFSRLKSVISMRLECGYRIVAFERYRFSS